MAANPGKIMPFWQHVFELRNRLLIVVITFLILSISAYLLYPLIFPMIQSIIGESLFVFTITEGFITRITIAIYSGLFTVIPMLLIQLVLFIFPALQGSEKVFFVILVMVSFVLFVVGIVFSWKLILPMSVEFLKRPYFYPQQVDRIIGYRTWITFVFRFLLGFGLCFEFPVVLLFLLKTGLVKLSFLVKYFKIFIVAWFIIAAIITPPDIVSQLALALPMNILYLMCLLIARIFRLGMDKKPIEEAT